MVEGFPIIKIFHLPFNLLWFFSVKNHSTYSLYLQVFKIPMHEITIDKSLSKSQKYEEIIPQIEGLMEGENDLVANLANIAAALKQTFGFFWVGFYLV